MKKLLPPKQFIGVPIASKQTLRMIKDTPRHVYVFWYLDEEGNVRRNSYSEKQQSTHALLQMKMADQRNEELKACIFRSVKKELQRSSPGIRLSMLDTELKLQDYEDFDAYYHAIMQEALMIYQRPLASLMIAAQPRLEDGVYRFSFSFPSYVSYEMLRSQKDEIKEAIADFISDYAISHRKFAKRVLCSESYKGAEPIFTEDNQLIYIFEPKIRERMLSFVKSDYEDDYQVDCAM